MAFPLDAQEALYIETKRFGLRVGNSAADAVGGAAYALDEGALKIPTPYMNWDYHLNNTIWKILGFPNVAQKYLIFFSPTTGTGERYSLAMTNVGIADNLTFPKANAIGGKVITIHAATPIQTKAVATLMQWVFDCIATYGPG